MYLQLPPWLRLALDTIFRCAVEVGLMIEDSFEHSARIIKRETDAEREQAWQEQDFLHPGARMKFALRANIKDRHRNRSGEENRNIDK